MIYVTNWSPFIPAIEKQIEGHEMETTNLIQPAWWGTKLIMPHCYK